MNNTAKFPLILNLIIGAAASIIIFFIVGHYSLLFFLSYTFFIIAGIGAYKSFNICLYKNINDLPLNLVSIVISYIYWAYTAFISAFIGLLPVFPLKLFFLLELLPFTFVFLLSLIFKHIAERYETYDGIIRIHDAEIIEINRRLNKIAEKAQNLNENIKQGVCSHINSLTEAFKYSEATSPNYSFEMFQSINVKLSTIETEMEDTLNVQPTEALSLNAAITHLINTVKDNDEICKMSKR